LPCGDQGGVDKDKVFYPKAQRIALKEGSHHIGSFVFEFFDDVPMTVDPVGIVAGSTGHCVVAFIAAENIVAESTFQDVVAGPAVELVVIFLPV
jgi:hypothetical protein